MDIHPVGIIFVHGIQGSPKQFDFLVERLPVGTPYKNVLLPGHGATVKEFRTSGRGLWLSAVKEACSSVAPQCQRLVFVGHSMGCLLGMLAAEEFAFSDMLLLCCPYYIRFTWRFLKCSTLMALPGVNSGDPFVEALRSSNSVSSDTPFGYLTCAHPYFELFRLMREVRELKQKPSSRMRFFFSEHDEIVSKRSASFALSHGAESVETLIGCGHSLFSEEGRQQLERALLALLD